MMYLPLDNNADEVRLLTILPQSTASPDIVHCTLMQASLKDFTPQYECHLSALASTMSKRQILSTWFASQCPSLNMGTLDHVPTDAHRFKWGDYAALSYVWGHSGITRKIVVNGHDVQVTENLEAALRALRARSIFRGMFRLWVDALCINQHDDKERGQQVSKMRDIYGSSWNVVAWLGAEADESNKALDLLETLSAVFEDHQKGLELNQRLQSDPDFLGKGCWVAVHEFLKRAYWGRLWIIQEIAMGALGTIVLCGSRIIDWKTLCYGIGTIREHLFVVKNKLLEYDRSYLGIQVSTAWETQNLHRVWLDLWVLSLNEDQCSKHLGIHRLLEISNFSLVSDPRDKVYGLLGIMSPGISEQIVPDYSLDCRAVFAATAKACILEQKNLDLLRECNPWGKKNAPSWAPDWTWNGRLRTNKPPRPYNASRGTSPICMFSEDEFYLTCKGFIISEIDGLGPKEVAQGFGPPSRRSWSHDGLIQPSRYRSAYGSDTATKEALCHCLVGAQDSTRDSVVNPYWQQAILNLPSDTKHAMAEFEKRQWERFARDAWWYAGWESWRRAHDHFWLGERQFSEYFEEKIPADTTFEDCWGAYISWQYCRGGRRFVTTATGHFGWAPDNREGEEEDQAQRGDMFCIIFGCSTPIVVRPCGLYYQVIGEGYIQGLMEGEAMKLLQEGKCQTQDFTFC